MIALSKILTTLQAIAPLNLAESWDNVGLLLGDPDQQIDRVMTCLTVSSETVLEAIETRAQLIVSHHPMPFKPLNRITTANLTGRLLLQCARAGIAIYSPHTAWDNAAQGINWQLAEMLGLLKVEPLTPLENATEAGIGQGRMGELSQPVSLAELRSRLSTGLGGGIRWRSTHDDSHRASKIGIICGSGGSYWSAAARRGCDTLLTGEATYHQCLEAEENGVAVMMVGHFASEFFSMKKLATELAASHESLVVECSQREHSQF